MSDTLRRTGTAPLPEAPHARSIFLRRLVATLIAAWTLVLPARGEEPAPNSAPPADAPGSLIVYCSADSVYFQPVLEAFTRETGIKVRPVFDTEATKTFGLVQRLINEQGDAAIADVFVSSEVLGMIRLSNAGLLEPYISQPAEEAFSKRGGYPRMMKAHDRTWTGFARRARVLVYNTKFVTKDDAPLRLAQLADPKWKGRVAMARPQFGTTRSQLAALHMISPSADDPTSGFSRWLDGLFANNVRLYDGNSSVVRAVASGEAYVGLTDNDDVHAGWANGWPIGMLRISSQIEDITHDRGPSHDPNAGSLLNFPESALQTFHTVGILKSSKRQTQARRFVDFVLSKQADQILSSGDAKTYTSYHPMLLDPLAGLDARMKAPDLYFMDIDYEEIARHADAALKMFEEREKKAR